MLYTLFFLFSTTYLYTATTSDESSEVDYLVSILITNNTLPYITTSSLADKKSSLAITSQPLSVITSQSLTDIAPEVLNSISPSLNDITSPNLNDVTSETLTSETLTSETLTSTSPRLNDITSPRQNDIASPSLNDITSQDKSSQFLPSLTYEPIKKGVIYSDAPETSVTMLQDNSKEKLHDSLLMQTTTAAW
jgi:hypothetical protein